jgi:hypothetical protein
MRFQGAARSTSYPRNETFVVPSTSRATVSTSFSIRLIVSS